MLPWRVPELNGGRPADRQSVMDAALLPEYLPDDPGFVISQVISRPDAVIVEAEVTLATANCPSCDCPSDRVHSRYVRRVRDLPCRGRELILVITVRKFVCAHLGCRRSIFCERLPRLTAAHARTTVSLTDSHRSIGFALGGEAGARLARHVAMPTSADTLLRRVKSATEPEGPRPRYVGVDDWSLRKGQTYGTILIDLERHRVIDILPGRDGEALKEWLRHHPEVEIISRDRWAAYAEAATEAAPNAKQVADRWHLLKNLREAVERLFERKYTAVKEAIGAAAAANKAAMPIPTPRPDATAPPPNPTPSPPSARQEARQAKRRRRVERYKRARRLHSEGYSLRRIARVLQIGRDTVERYVRQDHCPDWQSTRSRSKKLRPRREQVDQLIQSGYTNAAEIHRRLQADGCDASYIAVRRFVRRRMAAIGVARQRNGGPALVVATVPSARRVAFEWVRRAPHRTPDEQLHVDAVCVNDELRAALALADEFMAMIRKERPEALESWLVTAETSTCPEMVGFAKGIRQDQSAVRAAMTEPWSNGQVEGAVNRLKAIKRQMYGKAGFALLRARVRHAA